MKRKDLEKFREAYDTSMKRAIKGLDKNGNPIEEQSDWVYFEKETLEKMLKQIQGEGGIKFYFGQYDKENLYILPRETDQREDYIGRVSVAMVGCKKDENGKLVELELDDEVDSDSIQNGGSLCPPFCNI